MNRHHRAAYAAPAFVAEDCLNPVFAWNYNPAGGNVHIRFILTCNIGLE
jgi:hypothetical protein